MISKVKRRLFNYAAVLLCLFLTACGTTTTSLKKIEPFTFIDHQQANFGTDDLEGSVWVADFIFTSCETVCQPMTAEMASLQQAAKERDIPVQFVSFSVDPTIDTPEILHDYVSDFTDDTSNWHLLTGYTQDDIEEFAREQFNTIVQKPSSSTQVIHSTNFYLVDQEGHIVGEFNFIDPAYQDELLATIEKIGK